MAPGILSGFCFFYLLRLVHLIGDTVHFSLFFFFYLLATLDNITQKFSPFSFSPVIF